VRAGGKQFIRTPAPVVVVEPDPSFSLAAFFFLSSAISLLRFRPKAKVKIRASPCASLCRSSSWLISFVVSSTKLGVISTWVLLVPANSAILVSIGVRRSVMVALSSDCRVSQVLAISVSAVSTLAP
jgi:hypothetical protein